MKKGLLFIFAMVFIAVSVNAQHDFTTDPNADGSVYKHVVDNSKAIVMVTHSTSQDVVSGTGVACGSGGVPADNSFYRVFDLAGDFGITGEFTISQLDAAVEAATGGDQPADLRIYSLDGTFVLANLTLLGEEAITFGDDAALSVVETTLATPIVVPAGAVIVFEFHIPENAGGNTFYPGANSLGESDDSWIKAEACGITDPVTYSSIGFSTCNLVMNVWGEEIAGITYTATFTVDDGTDPLEDVLIDIDGGTYTGTTDASGIVIFEDLDAGTYSFTATLDNYTYSGTTTFDVVDEDVDVVVSMDIIVSVEGLTAKGISIYPNPSNGVFNVNVENNFNLEVLDITGKVINTRVLTGNSTVEINTAGVYFLRFSNEKGSVTQRVIVQ